MRLNIIRLSDARDRLMSNSLDKHRIRESMNLLPIFTMIVSTSEKMEGNNIV
jgi:hypothetical protein